MIVFAGVDWGMEGQNTNAVLLQAYAKLGGTGSWTTLIANGVAGSPAARGGQSAVYDAANNQMIIFGGLDVADSNALNDVVGPEQCQWPRWRSILDAVEPIRVAPGRARVSHRCLRCCQQPDDHLWRSDTIKSNPYRCLGT